MVRGYDNADHQIDDPCQADPTHKTDLTPTANWAKPELSTRLNGLVSRTFGPGVAHARCAQVMPVGYQIRYHAAVGELGGTRPLRASVDLAVEFCLELLHVV